MTGAHTSGGACGSIRGYAKNLIPGLTCPKGAGSSRRKRPANGIQSGTCHRCCMAVVSSCREMSGLVLQRAKPLPLVARRKPRTLGGLPVSNRRKVGMTSSPHGLYVQGCTRATMAYTEGSQRASGSQSQKLRPSSDRRLQLAFVKLESLVIAGQQHRGECVPEPCTHRPSSHESGGHPKSSSEP